MSKSQKAPKPPDPYATADAQTQFNQDAAQYNAAINRINTYTPYGSQEYDVVGTDPRSGAPIYEQRLTLSPEEQEILDAQRAQNMDLTNLGSDVISRMSGDPIDTSGLPNVRSGFELEGPGYQYGFNRVGPQFDLDRSSLPPIQRSVGPDDLGGFRDEAEAALYDRNTAYLDRDFGRREDELRTRLANQGIVEGSEAYTNAIDDFERGREMSFRQARNEAVIGGGAEASRMFDIDLASGGFRNSARQQAMAEELASGGFYNQAAGQANQDSFLSANMANESRMRDLSEQLSSANLSNEARAQALQEVFALRNQPINEFNAYRSQSQVSMPQFEGTARVGVNPADFMGARYNSYQGELDVYNAQQQSRNAFMQGLFGLGGAYISRPRE